MDRRRLLSLLAAAAALGVGRTPAAGAQPREAGRWIPADAPGERAAAAGLTPVTPGVTLEEVRIGMSAAFRGTAAAVGAEFYRGAQACYQDVNARGGVHGRRVAVVALDDGYEPGPCVRNTIQLLEREPVFTLSNYVGTPTLTRALPVIKRYHDHGVVLVGNLTGAQPQREPPYADQVFNIRASYRQEMMALVDRFWQLGARSFGVFYQIDAYGRSGTDGVARGLAHRGARIVAEATYPRGARFADDMAPAVGVLKQAGVDVVLCTGAYQGCAAFVRAARDAGWKVPISNLSFVGADQLLALLVQHGRATNRDYTRGLVNSQVVPCYDDTSRPGVIEYRALMDRHAPSVPAALRDSAYVAQRYSFISLEGFVNARVVVEALRRAGPRPTRRSFKQALESMRGLDLGIGSSLTFGPDRHQGLDSVYFTRVVRDRWVPVDDWAVALAV